MLKFYVIETKFVNVTEMVHCESQKCSNSCSATHIFNTILHKEIFFLFPCL